MNATINQAAAIANEQVSKAQATATAAREAVTEKIQKTVQRAGEEINEAAAAIGIMPVVKPTKMQIFKKVALYATGTAVVAGVGYYAWKRFGPAAALAIASSATDVAQVAAETAVEALM